RRVVSHWAKFYRGQFAGRLLADERPLPESTDELVARAQEFYDVEFTPHTASKPAALTIVLGDCTGLSPGAAAPPRTPRIRRSRSRPCRASLSRQPPRSAGRTPDSSGR